MSEKQVTTRGRKPKNETVEAEVVEEFKATMTTEEYAEYSKQNGRYYGRPEGVKTKCTTQELRILINAGWTPKMVMDKHGMTEEEHAKLVNQLSKEERRDTSIKYSDTGYRK